jgi:hypothetical protein
MALALSPPTQRGQPLTPWQLGALAPAEAWRRTLAIRIICDQAMRGAHTQTRPLSRSRALTVLPACALSTVLLSAYRERMRRAAAYLAAHRLPRLSRVLLSHHWSAWAAVAGAWARAHATP